MCQEIILLFNHVFVKALLCVRADLEMYVFYSYPTIVSGVEGGLPARL